MSFREGSNNGQTVGAVDKMMHTNDNKAPQQSRNHHQQTEQVVAAEPLLLADTTLASMRNKDFYFAKLNSFWLTELCQAKKRLQDLINAQPTSALSSQLPSQQHQQQL